MEFGTRAPRMVAEPSTFLGVRGLVTLIAALATAPLAHAQDGPTGRFTGLAVIAGFGEIGGASTSLGVQIEQSLTRHAIPGTGAISLTLSAERFSWSDGLFEFEHIPVGVRANYHVAVSGVDLYSGLGVGYVRTICDYRGSGIAGLCEEGGTYVIARVGARYFLGSRFAIQADGGVGGSAASVGLLYRVR